MPRRTHIGAKARRGMLRHRPIKRGRLTDIPASVRRRVYERDEFCCRECGRYLEAGERHIHHCHTRGAGGLHIESNCITVCAKHHDAIHNSPERLAYWRAWADQEAASCAG